MYRLLGRDDVERMLAPWGCRYLGELFEGTERWLTGWDFEFILSREDGGYHEFMVLKAIEMSIEPTMPAGFEPKGCTGLHKPA